MAQVLDNAVKLKLKSKARRNRRTMEEEARAILHDAVHHENGESLGVGTELALIFSKLDFDPNINELRGYPVQLGDRAINP